jgi:hypothetical protein
VRSITTRVRSNAQARCSLAAQLRLHANAQQASAGMRLRWNMPECVRPQEMRSTALSAPDFPETRQKLKKVNKNAKPFFKKILYIYIYIFFGFYLYKSTK